MEEINGFYDDNGNKINSDLISKPGLCLVCSKHEVDDVMEQMFCTMTRYDQQDEDEFKCGAYKAK
jgi:hypothetical protein